MILHVRKLGLSTRVDFRRAATVCRANRLGMDGVPPSKPRTTVHNHAEERSALVGIMVRTLVHFHRHWTDYEGRGISETGTAVDERCGSAWSIWVECRSFRTVFWSSYRRLLAFWPTRLLPFAESFSSLSSRCMGSNSVPQRVKVASRRLLILCSPA